MLWGHGQNAICSGSCVQAKRIFLQSKNIADLKVLGLGVFFLFAFGPLPDIQDSWQQERCRSWFWFNEDVCVSRRE